MVDVEKQLRDLGDQIKRDFAHGPPPTASVGRRARARKVLVGLGSVGLLLVVVLGGYAGVRALGERSPKVTNENVLATAALTTKQEGSARFEFEMTTQWTDGPAQGTGEVDFAAQRSYVKLETEEDLGGLSSLEAITDGTTVYVRGLSLETDKWVKSDFGDSAQNSSESAGVQQWDAGSHLDYLKTVSEDIEILGQEQFDGVAVTHYRAIIDTAVAWEQASGVEADVHNASSEVWVDEQGRVRKMTWETSGQSGGGSVDRMLTMRFFDFGAPVDIELPRPDDVTEQDPFPVSESEGSRSSGDDSFILMGKDGFQGPVVALFDGELMRQGCVMGAPEWATKAELIEEVSDFIVARIYDLDKARSSGDFPDDLACFDDLPDNLESLREHPTHYTLRLKGDGQLLSVPFTVASSPGDPGTD